MPEECRDARSARGSRVYRLLLFAYPRAFRGRYASELHLIFMEEQREARYRGVSGRLAFWLHIGRDLAASVCRQRTAPLRAFYRRRLTRRTLGTSPAARSQMDTILQDLRYALRLMRQRPAFTAAAVLSLALGIGANSLIFGLMDGLVLNPFPYPDAGRLVSVGVTFPRVSSEEGFIEALSPAECLDIGKASTLKRVIAFDLGNRNLSGGDLPERVFSAFVWGNPFETFGMKPFAGRGFLPRETEGAGQPVAIISHRIWQSRFGSNRDLVGRTIHVNGVPKTLVGIMPPGLLLLGADLWIPMGVDPSEFPRDRRQFTLVARLAPGVSMDQANAELATIARQVEQQHRPQFKEYEGWRLHATSWTNALTGEMRPVAFILLGAVGCVLLIACANITNLTLARASSRQTEIAVRLALGAGRLRLARQLLTETLVVALVGAGGGLLIARIGLPLALTLVPAEVTALGPAVGVSGRVLAFSLLLALLSALAIALVPVLQATRTDPQQSLKSEGRGATASRASRRMRHTFIVAQVALALVLLAGAGLLIRSVARIRQVDPGVDPARVLTMRLTLPPQKYDGAAIGAFFDQLVARLERLPGVTAAAAASQFPPVGPFASRFEIEGREIVGGAPLPSANWTIATRTLLSTLRVPLRTGRSFAVTDRPGSPPVALVNQAFARRFFPSNDALGHRIRLGELGERAPWMEIVGIAADTRNQGLLAPPAPEMFVSAEQWPGLWNQLFLLIRTEGDPARLLPAVRQQILELDREQPVYAIQTMEEAFGKSLFQQRIAMILLAIFAVVALVLAAIGIYGVMSYSVTARTQEIGIRMALGAAAGDVRRMVVGQAVRLLLVGGLVGMTLALLLGPLMSSLLFGITATDPVTLAGVTALLGAVGLLAGYLPALRASRVDPMAALRYG